MADCCKCDCLVTEDCNLILSQLKTMQSDLDFLANIGSTTERMSAKTVSSLNCAMLNVINLTCKIQREHIQQQKEIEALEARVRRLESGGPA